MTAATNPDGSPRMADSTSAASRRPDGGTGNQTTGRPSRSSNSATRMTEGVLESARHECRRRAQREIVRLRCPGSEQDVSRVAAAQTSDCFTRVLDDRARLDAPPGARWTDCPTRRTRQRSSRRALPEVAASSRSNRGRCQRSIAGCRGATSRRGGGARGVGVLGDTEVERGASEAHPADLFVRWGHHPNITAVPLGDAASDREAHARSPRRLA